MDRGGGGSKFRRRGKGGFGRLVVSASPFSVAPFSRLAILRAVHVRSWYNDGVVSDDSLMRLNINSHFVDASPLFPVISSFSFLSLFFSFFFFFSFFLPSFLSFFLSRPICPPPFFFPLLFSSLLRLSSSLSLSLFLSVSLSLDSSLFDPPFHPSLLLSARDADSSAAGRTPRMTYTRHR